MLWVLALTLTVRIDDNLFDPYSGFPYTVRASDHDKIIGTVSTVIMGMSR